ncbi:RNA 2',3'-cyclic phosphodiesterase [Micromonospora sp. NPDC048170]|uniref:RNA 2',3'-cyclic phosphodiesterase n=1 Tax=Micromonospora sp. NPDC048170 TaxID=3154819 RepID=UPI0033F242F8
MRLFVAIYPPSEVVAHLGVQVARLRAGARAAAGIDVRLADPADAHVTLAFLGDVEAERLVAVQSALGLAADRFRDGRPAAPRLRLAGGGRFGQDRSTVLWVDLRGEVESVETLAQLIRSRLRHADLSYDERPFRPHLTVARPGDRMSPVDVAADTATLDDYEGPQWPATEMVLVRSHPGPRHTYERLAAWPL